MAKWSEESLKRFQAIFEKDPHSPVFAPLADAYLELNMLEQAEQTVRRGLQNNPNLASGEVVLGKILLARKRPQEAIEHLEKAAQLDPSNVQAQLLLGHTYSELKNPKKALKAYKVILFYNPHYEKIQKAVEKLESLTADEYDEETFSTATLEALREKIKEEAENLRQQELQMQKDDPQSKHLLAGPATNSRIKIPSDFVTNIPNQLQRVLALIDALILRNDLQKAHVLLKDAKIEFNDHDEIIQRVQMLEERLLPSSGDDTTSGDESAHPVEMSAQHAQKGTTASATKSPLHERPPSHASPLHETMAPQNQAPPPLGKRSKAVQLEKLRRLQLLLRKTSEFQKDS